MRESEERPDRARAIVADDFANFAADPILVDVVKPAVAGSEGGATPGQLHYRAAHARRARYQCEREVVAIALRAAVKRETAEVALNASRSP